MTPEFESLVLRAFGALGNGVLQGIPVAVCVLVGLRFLRNSSAATRYVVTFAGLLTVAVLPLVHFLAAPSAPSTTPPEPSALETEVANTPSDSEAPLPGSDNELDSTPARTPFRVLLDPQLVLRSPRAEADGNHGSQDPHSPPDAGRSPRTFQPPEEAALLPGINLFLESGWNLAPRTTPSDEIATPTGFGTLFRRWPFEDVLRVTLPTSYAMGALALWAALAAVRLAILGAQCRVLSRLKRSMEPAPDRVVSRFLDLRRKMGVQRTVRLGMIPDLRSPIAVGFFQPAILLPLPVAAAPDEELDSLLRHELAHVRRRDDWTNLVQQVVKAVYFFHPGVLALSRRLTLDREIACDDHVLAANGKPRSYALFLTDFASRTHGRQFAAAPAAFSNPTQLQERIHMILDPHRNTSPRVAPTRAGVLTLAALLIAITGIGAAPRVSVDAATTVSDPTAVVANAPDANVTADVDVDVDVDVSADLTDLSIEGNPTTLAVVTTHTEDHAVDAYEGGDEDPKPKSKSKAKSKASSENSNTSSTITIQSSADKPGSPDRVFKIERHVGSGPSVTLVTPHPNPAPRITALPAPAPWPAPTVDPTKPTHAKPPRALAHSPADDRDLEERIRRLERLVDRLASKPSPEKPGEWKGERKGDGNEFLYKSAAPNFERDHVLHFDALSRELGQVSKEVERSLRDAERAARQSLKSADIAREKAASMQVGKIAEARRKALEGHRDGLRKQIESLQSNIERLEGELERLDDAVESAEEAEEATREALRESHRDIEHSHAELAKELENASREKERALRQLEKKAIEKKMELDRHEVFEKAKDQEKDKEKEKDKPKQKQKAPDEVPAPAPAPATAPTPSTPPSSGVRF